MTGKLFGREPALILGAVQALIALAVGFGLDVTAEQVGLISAAVAAVLAVVVRAQVVPAETHEEQLDHLVTLAGALPDPDDVPSTGSPERGAVDAVTVLYVALLVLGICAALKYLGWAF